MWFVILRESIILLIKLNNNFPRDTFVGFRSIRRNHFKFCLLTLCCYLWFICRVISLKIKSNGWSPSSMHRWWEDQFVLIIESKNNENKKSYWAFRASILAFRCYSPPNDTIKQRLKSIVHLKYLQKTKQHFQENCAKRLSFTEWFTRGSREASWLHFY